jgi:hypothetical protein
MMAATSPEAETIIRQTEQMNRLVTESTSGLQRLTNQLLPVERAQARYEEAVRKTNAALERGRISQEQANTLLAAAQANITRAEQAQARLLATNDNAARSTRNFGGIIGQAGFQVQDFAVQVASGQTALTAFVQQGSQLAGIFGPAGAIAGAVLAIGGIAAQLLLGKSASEQFADAIKAAEDRLDRMDASARRARSGVSDLAESMVTLRERLARLTPDQREFEFERLQNELTVLQRQREALFRQAERASGLQGIQNIAANAATGLRARGVDPTDPVRGLPEQIRLATAAMLEFRQVTADGSQSTEQADAALARLANRFAEAARLPGPLQEQLRRAVDELDKLYPRGEQVDVAMQRIRAALLAAGEAAGVYSGQVAAAAAETERLSRLAAEAARDVGQENARALQRARERAEAIARGPAAAALYDAEQRRRDNADRYYEEQKRRDEQRFREARMGEDAIRAEIQRTDDARRQAAAERARLESENDRNLEQARQRQTAARSGAAAARREERLDERSLRQRNQLLSSLDEEAAANIRLEEALKRIAEARRRNQLSEEEATRYSQMARDRRQQEIVRSLDKSDLDAEQIKRTAELASDLGGVLRDTFQDAVRDGKSFADVLKNIEQRLLKLGDKYLLEPLLQNLAQLATNALGGTGKGGGMGGGLGGLLGNLFGTSFTAEAAGTGLAKGAELVATAAILHTGGVVGDSSVPTRAVPASVFLDAPRYHSGGFAGGMPFANDEVPAVLRREELVLTKEQQRALAGRPMTVNNYISTPSTAEFRRSGGQISADLARAVARGGRNR